MLLFIERGAGRPLDGKAWKGKGAAGCGMRLTAWCLCRLVLMAGANALQHSPSNDERANALYAAPLNVCCESHGMVHGVMSVFYTLCITTVKVLLSLQERAPPPVGQGGRG